MAVDLSDATLEEIRKIMKYAMTDSIDFDHGLHSHCSILSVQIFRQSFILENFLSKYIPYLSEAC